jgi:hypothetical protein
MRMQRIGRPPFPDDRNHGLVISLRTNALSASTVGMYSMPPLSASTLGAFFLIVQ